jgi:tetratricopeptide (TPR) repeat protein
VKKIKLKSSAKNKQQLNLAQNYLQSGDFLQAEHIYKKILNEQTNNVDIYCNLGFIALKRGKSDEALQYYKKAVRLNPINAASHFNLGVIFQNKGNFEEAISSYQKSLELAPNILTYNNLGSAFQEKGHIEEAIICYRNAIQLDPNYANAYNNLGIALKEKGEFGEAMTCFRKVIELNPQHADAYNNLGSISVFNGNHNESLNHYRKAIQLDPRHAEAHYGLSLTLLSLCRFNEGWTEHEWRWRTKDFSSQRRNYSQPLWDGSAINGRTILLHSEQGLGDSIQFIRYAPVISQMGASVIVECPKELKSLIQRVEGVNKVIMQGEWLPDFDIHCPLLSLPLVFHTTLESIPSKLPYIAVDSVLVQKWGNRLRADNSKLKVGLVWAGNPGHKNDRHRSCSLEIFLPLLQLKGTVFFSLQKGEAAKQTRDLPKDILISDYIEEITDFADTAALMENLDLVISVDTAVVHLAGALGKPVWTLLPFNADWRWMLDREDSPWYSTMRLFRQPSLGDWESVIAKVKDELLGNSVNN